MEQSSSIRAFYSDETEDYRFPCEPGAGERVTIRFRTGANGADRVFLVIGEPRVLMEKADTDGLFDYYQAVIRVGETKLSYYFEIETEGTRHVYNRRGLDAEQEPRYFFCIFPGFSTPEWAKGAVMYQIFVDRFRNGDPENDVTDREYYYNGEYAKQRKNWEEYPGSRDVASFYGGDLQGVLDKLDYLEALGIDAIYLNPVFVSPSNHKYDTQDYDFIDPHFGKIEKDGGKVLEPGDTDNRHAGRYIRCVTEKENLEAGNRLFVRLVEAAHARGIRVILDGVFNHCGSFHKWLDRERIYEGREGYAKGAYESKDSPYRKYFRFEEEETPMDAGEYEGWWGYETLPKLNYEASDELMDEILRIARKWVSPPYNADGWRLDVAADLGHSLRFNHGFWKRFRQEVKGANPEAIVLAEHYGDASPWLMGDEWDTVMNYDAFMEPVTWFLTGMEKHSDAYRKDLKGNNESFLGAMTHHMSSFSYSSLLTAMNELSNHDHSRFLTRTSGKVGRVEELGPEAAEEGVRKAVFKEAVVLQMTWPGAPAIYYGDEAGVCGFTDPDNRRTYPWGKEDRDLLEFHREMIALHKGHRPLIYGSMKYLYTDRDILCYGRFDREEQIAVLLNNRREETFLEVPVWELGVKDGQMMETLMTTSEEGYSAERRTYIVEGGMLRIAVPGECAVVLCRR